MGGRPKGFPPILFLTTPRPSPGTRGHLRRHKGHASLHGGLVSPVLDGGDHSGNALLDLRLRRRVGLGLSEPLPVQFVDVSSIGLHRRADVLRRYQPFLEPGKGAFLQPVAADGAAVGADRAAMMVQTAVAVWHDGSDRLFRYFYASPWH